MSMLDINKFPEHFSDLVDTSRVLFREDSKDLGRSLTVQTQALANVELLRRDAVLNQANSKVSVKSINLLRSSTLLSGRLFEDSIVKEVQDNTERSI